MKNRKITFCFSSNAISSFFYINCHTRTNFISSKGLANSITISQSNVTLPTSFGFFCGHWTLNTRLTFRTIYWRKYGMTKSFSGHIQFSLLDTPFSNNRDYVYEFWCVKIDTCIVQVHHLSILVWNIISKSQHGTMQKCSYSPRYDFLKLELKTS